MQITTDERLRRAAERLRLLAEQWQGGMCDAKELQTLEIQIGTLTYHANLANMKAATRRSEDTDETKPMDAGGAAPLRRAS